MLASVSQTSPALSRRSVALLVALAFAVFLLPTFRVAPLDAQEAPVLVPPAPAPADAKEQPPVEAKAANLPTPDEILEKLKTRRDSLRNLVVEATWEEYRDNKPYEWQDGTLYWDNQGHIRSRDHWGLGALAAADVKNADWNDQGYTGRFSVSASKISAATRVSNPRKWANTADGYHYFIYNARHGFPGDSIRNPMRCMDLDVIVDLSAKLSADDKRVRVQPVKGQTDAYELSYGLWNLNHRVLVDAGKGWVVTCYEKFLPSGEPVNLSTCDYRRGEDGWWVPSAGQICTMVGGPQVVPREWRFKVKRIAVNDPKFDPGIFQPEVEGFTLRDLTESVTVTVVDRNGNPVEGVGVRFELQSGASHLIADAGKPTDKEGRFMIDGLPKPPISFEAIIMRPVSATGSANPFTASVTIQPGQKDVRIVFDPKPSR